MAGQGEVEMTSKPLLSLWGRGGQEAHLASPAEKREPGPIQQKTHGTQLAFGGAVRFCRLSFKETCTLLKGNYNLIRFAVNTRQREQNE